MRLLILFISLLISQIGNGQIISASPPYRVRGGCTLVLDTYTGAQAAWSLRKLRDAYSGPAIRIRRSSDNQEADIGFAGVCGSQYLDTAALKTFISSDDAYVVTVYDQTGNSRPITNSTASGQPKIATAGVLNYVDGWVALEFDNTNDHLVSNYQNLSTISSFLVAAKNTNDDFGLWQNEYFDIGETSVSMWGYFNRFRLSGVVTAGTFKGTGTLAATSAGEMALMFGYWDWTETSGVSHWRNGTANTNSANAAGGMRHGNGGEVYYGGRFYECIIWATDKTSDRDNIAANINTFYSIY